MRVPINWLGEYVKIPKSLSVLTDRLTMAGHMLDKIDNVHGDIVIDLELRGNRADCYSIIGIAREVSALFQTPVKYPAIYPKLKKVHQLKEVELAVKTPLIRRVVLVVIKNIKIADSPSWLKNKLEEYGIASINNIVDLTNYVMVELGEPMHAFDLDKLGKNLEIRFAKDKERMATFLGKDVVLTKDDLVLSNGKSLVSIAGAIGEKFHSISSDTKNVLLEAASYNRASIRRTIHKHNLLTDSGIRHEKELDPNIVDRAVYRFLELIKENKWGKVEPYVCDYYPKPVKPWGITLSYNRLNSLVGKKIEAKVVKNILKGLNFQIVKETKSELAVLVPTYRTDVVLEEDLIEEVIRIQGYDKIPTQILSLEIPFEITPNYIKQELRLKNELVSLGFDEVINSPFVQEKNLGINKYLGSDKVTPVKIVNRPSPDFEEMRLLLFPNLVEATTKIINENGEEARLFEVGKVYYKKKEKYVEERKLGMAYWLKNESEFVYFKGYLEALFTKIGLKNVRFENITETDLNLIDQYKVTLDKGTIGFGGQMDNIFYAEIDLDLILNKQNHVKVQLWPKYPPQIEDLTLTLPERTRVGEVMDSMLTTSSLVSNVELRDIYKNSYTFRIWYQDPKKTLTDSEVEVIRKKIIERVKSKFGGVVKN